MSEILNEKFDPSMPDWLKRVLSRNNTNRNHPNRAKDDEGQDFIYDSGSIGQLAKNLRDAGIDLNTIKFTEGEIPTSPKDKRLKSPNIPFLHIQLKRYPSGWDGNSRNPERKMRTVDQVYSKGYNDDEPFLLYRSPDGWSERGSGNKHFKYVPMSQLLPYVVDFCYIDMDAQGINPLEGDKNLRAKRAQRRNQKDWERAHDDIVRDPKKQGSWSRYSDQRRWYGPDRGYDKSGYKLPDPLKYRKKLDALNASKYQQILEDYYNQLISYRDGILETVKSVDPKDRDTSLYRDTYSRDTEELRAMDAYYEAAHQYARIMKDIDNAIDQDKRKGWDDNKTLKVCIDGLFGKGIKRVTDDVYFYNNATIAELRKSMKNLKELADKVVYDKIELNYDDLPESISSAYALRLLRESPSNNPSKILFIEEVAADDFENGQPYSVSDFNLFKRTMAEAGYTVDESDFDYYFECIYEARDKYFEDNYYHKVNSNDLYDDSDEYIDLDEAAMTLVEIHNKYYEDIPIEDFNAVIALDPTYKELSDKMGIYGKWLLNQYKKNGNQIPDSEVKDQLEMYNRVKQQLPLDKRDINKIKSLQELIEIVHSSDITDKSLFQLKAEDVEGVNFIGKAGPFEIYSPQTYEASKYLRGDNAVWCTGRHNDRSYYDSYTKNGKLYIFIDSKDPENKYQMYIKDSHPDKSSEFRDKRNGEVSLIQFILHNKLIDDFSKLEPFKNMQELEQSLKYKEYADGKEFIYSDETAEQLKKDRNLRSLICNLKFADGIEKIMKNSLNYFESLPELILPDSVVSIPAGAFAASNYQRIKLSDNLVRIPSEAFDVCNKLKEIILPKNLRFIDLYAFRNIPADTVIRVPREIIDKLGTPEGLKAPREEWDRVKPHLRKLLK